MGVLTRALVDRSAPTFAGPAARDAALYALAILCVLLAVAIAFWPGYVTVDGIDQLRQGRMGVYNSWHPPLLSWLWGRLDSLWPGPQSLMLLQCGLFCLGIGLLAWRFTRSAAGAAVVLATGLFPVNFKLLGEVGKDTQLAAALLAAVGLLAWAERRESRWPIAPALLLCFYGCAIRHNALPAAAPLLAYAAAILFRGRSRPWWIVAATLASTFAFATGTWLVDDALTRGRPTYVFQQVMLHDLAALSLAEHRSLFPAYLREGPHALSLERIAREYSPRSIDGLAWPPNGEQKLYFSADANEVATLVAAWRGAVASHPAAYLRHRILCFDFLLGLTRYPPDSPYFPGVEPNDLGIRPYRSPLSDAFTGWLARHRDGLLFRGWPYLLVLVLELCGSAIAPAADRPLLWSLCGSGLSYALPYFLVGPTDDFRMLTWTVFAAVASLGPALAALQGLAFEARARPGSLPERILR